jgi:predicted DNA-binding transcriptional regulator YafY
MDRTERFYKIELLIRNRGSVPFADLMDELGVSRATLKRDLEYLRERMDAPIVYDRFANGYRFDNDAGPGSGSRTVRHELPGVWFSEREIHALLTMHQLIGGLDEGGVLARHLQPLLDKLHGMLGTSDGEAREMVKRIKVLSAAKRPVAPKHFELIGGALTRRQRVHLHYWVRSRREMTERVVSPQRLVHWRNTWYLDACATPPTRCAASRSTPSARPISWSRRARRRWHSRPSRPSSTPATAPSAAPKCSGPRSSSRPRRRSGCATSSGTRSRKPSCTATAR